MRVKVYVIELGLPPAAKRAAARILPAAVLLFGFGGAVDAAPQSFAAGEPLSSSKMNANFAEIDQRLSRVDAWLGAGNRYAAGAVFCGATATATTGDMSGFGVAKGYAAALTACRQTCSNAPTAHMCTADEVVRSAALGVEVAEGWYATGLVGLASASYTMSDCQGFSTISSSYYGVRWESSYPGPVWSTCATSYPVLCCDRPGP